MDIIQVSIRCATYNHVHYIRKCLDGFVMQKTNFKFEAIVHDDASSDGTTDIVREYAERYPDIIKPMIEKENQYSKNLRAMDDAINARLVGKYVAICEGDDYWTDPLKLQKQFDFMESHPECSMCFHPHYCLLGDGTLVPRAFRTKKIFYSTKDFIWRGGESISTNTLFFKRQYYLNYSERPEYWKNCPFGDEALTLFLSLQGKIGCLKDLMSVYRVQAVGSWTSKNKSLSELRKSINAMIMMNNQFDDYTNHQYHFFVVMKKMRIRIRYIRGYLRIKKHCFLSGNSK